MKWSTKLGGVAAPSRKCREATFERRRRGGFPKEPPRRSLKNARTAPLLT